MAVPRIARTITLRWTAVLSIAGAAAVGIHVALPWGWEYLRSIRGPMGVNRLALHAAEWLVIALAAYVASGIVPVKVRHLRFAHRYPPIWLAGPMSVVLLAAGQRFFPPLGFSHDLVIGVWPWRVLQLLAAIAAGVLVRAAVHSSVAADHGRGSGAAPEVDLSKRKLDWPTIDRWARTEESSGRDLLGYRAIASRFAAILTNEAVLWRRSAALAGPWGSGKSTILHWVDSDLRRTSGPHVWSCWVSCWGIEDSRFLAAHLLRQIIDVVNQKVDVSGLRGIPDAYLRMLGATKFGPLEWLFRRDQGHDVLDDLTKVVPVLEAANARIVVFIEDGDRAGVQDFDPGHLERLIGRLRDLERVSCVLALDPVRVPFDLSKLCEHVELMPLLDVDSVREVLSITRDHCLHDYKFIRPLYERSDPDRLDLKQDDGQGLLKYVRRHHDKDVCDTIRDVVETPRRLKHSVRRIARIWEKLHGEVDIDDLIAVSVIRECSPAVFRFFLTNIDNVRNSPDQFNKRPQLAKEEWARLIANDGDVAKAVRLVEALGLKQLTSGTLTRHDRPQGIQGDEPVDYFRRLLAEDIADGQTRDQTVLGDMDAWLADGRLTMIEGLVDAAGDRSQYLKSWEHFAWRIPNERFGDVVSTLFERILATMRTNSTYTSHEGLLACRRQFKRRGVKSILPPERLVRMIEQAMSMSLDFANELYYFWASTREGGPYSQQDRDEVRRALVRIAMELLTQPATLIRALQASENLWALRQLVIPVDSEEPDSIETDLSNWQRLAVPLVKAIQGAPNAVLPQVARLIGDTTDHIVQNDGLERRTDYAINRERTTALFGERVDALLGEAATANLETDDWLARDARSQMDAWLLERVRPK